MRIAEIKEWLVYQRHELYLDCLALLDGWPGLLCMILIIFVAMTVGDK